MIRAFEALLHGFLDASGRMQWEHFVQNSLSCNRVAVSIWITEDDNTQLPQ